MINRKWLFVIALLALVIPGVTLAQTNIRIDRTTIARNERVGVINVLPRNAKEFENIYERRPTRLEHIDMAKTRLRMSQIRQPTLEPYPMARTRAGFDAFVPQAEERTVLVVGHNVKGEFRFADGTSRNLTEMASLLSEQNKQAILLSCLAVDYVPQYPAATRNLTNKDAVRMVESIGNSFGHPSSSTQDWFSLNNSLMNRVQADIRRIERLSSTESIVRTTAIAGALTTSAGTLYIIERRRSNRKR